MKLRHSLPALTLSLALALGSQPLLAQSHGSHGGSGGGSHGGGSHGGGGGSHAVPRGSGGGGGSHPGYAPHGAEQRHPQAGTGYRYGYGHGYGNGHGYGYGYGHGYGYYRPYYGYGYGYPYYGYYPYSSYWPGVSLSLGWGYGYSEPYYGGGYYAAPAYSVGASAPYVAASGEDGGAPPPPARESERSYAGRSEGPSGRVRLEVRPEDTSVYVDDAFHGTAREARIMNLPPGRHRIELVRPGFATEHRDVAVVTGESQDVLVELLRP